MKLHAVLSDLIRRVGWENNTLYVQFHNKEIYAYFDVSIIEYEDFINSPSLPAALSRLNQDHTYNRI